MAVGALNAQSNVPYAKKIEEELAYEFLGLDQLVADFRRFIIFESEHMKKLIVSCKTADQVFEDFKNAAKTVRRRAFKGKPEYELSFDNKADFNRFVRNIPMLSAIIMFKPKSVYELAKLIESDVSNLNKVIQFFEEIGVITVKMTKSAGRTVKQPHVEYDEVTFRLAS